jgi:hypothetical protein
MPKMVQRTFKGTNGEDIPIIRQVDDDYEINELGGEENGRQYTEQIHDPKWGQQVLTGAVLPGLIGGGLGAIAGSRTGNAAQGFMMGMMPGLKNAADIGASAIEYNNPNSKLAAMGAGALSTGAAGLNQGLISGLTSSGGNIGQGMLEGLAQGGVGALQGGIGVVPGMQAVANAIPTLAMGAAQGSMWNAAGMAAAQTLNDPSFANIGQVGNIGNASKYMGGQWGNQYQPMTDRQKESGYDMKDFLSKGPDGNYDFNEQRFLKTIPNAQNLLKDFYDEVRDPKTGKKKKVFNKKKFLESRFNPYIREEQEAQRERDRQSAYDLRTNIDKDYGKDLYHTGRGEPETLSDNSATATDLHAERLEEEERARSAKQRGYTKNIVSDGRNVKEGINDVPETIGDEGYSGGAQPVPKTYARRAQKYGPRPGRDPNKIYPKQQGPERPQRAGPFRQYPGSAFVSKEDAERMGQPSLAGQMWPKDMPAPDLYSGPEKRTKEELGVRDRPDIEEYYGNDENDVWRKRNIREFREEQNATPTKMDHGEEQLLSEHGKFRGEGVRTPEEIEADRLKEYNVGLAKDHPIPAPSPESKAILARQEAERQERIANAARRRGEYEARKAARASAPAAPAPAGPEPVPPAERAQRPRRVMTQDELDASFGQPYAPFVDRPAENLTRTDVPPVDLDKLRVEAAARQRARDAGRIEPGAMEFKGVPDVMEAIPDEPARADVESAELGEERRPNLRYARETFGSPESISHDSTPYGRTYDVGAATGGPRVPPDYRPEAAAVDRGARMRVGDRIGAATEGFRTGTAEDYTGRRRLPLSQHRPSTIQEEYKRRTTTPPIQQRLNDQIEQRRVARGEVPGFTKASFDAILSQVQKENPVPEIKPNVGYRERMSKVPQPPKENVPVRRWDELSKEEQAKRFSRPEGIPEQRVEYTGGAARIEPRVSRFKRRPTGRHITERHRVINDLLARGEYAEASRELESLKERTRGNG